MSIALVSAAFKADLPAVPKLVLLALADSANDEDGGCWFLLRTLCAKTSLSERSLRDQFRVLRRSGFLRQEYRPGRSTLFYLSREALGVGIDPPRAVDKLFTAPARVAGTPARGAGTPARGAGTPARGAPISVSYPSPDPSINLRRQDANNSRLENRRPAAGRFGEGAAKAAPPGVGGLSEDQMRINRERFVSAMRSVFPKP